KASKRSGARPYAVKGMSRKRRYPERGLMRSDTPLIALEIGQILPPGIVALRAVLERALTLVDHIVLGVESEAERGALANRMEVLRSGLADASDPDSIRQYTDASFEVCEQAL